MMEATEDNNPNSIASSLLTLVEMITSAEQGGAQTSTTQQVQVSHTACASHSHKQQVQVSPTEHASHSQHKASTDQSHSTY